MKKIFVMMSILMLMWIWSALISSLFTLNTARKSSSQRSDMVGMPISWTHYKSTEECPKVEGKEE